MKRLSKRHIKADSYQDGKAWVRKYIDPDELEYDDKIRAILKADGDRNQKAKAIAERIQELLSESGYQGYEIQNVSVGETEIDWKQIDQLISQNDERAWEAKTDQEYQALKKQLQTETDPQVRQQIEQRINELDDMEYEGSKVSRLRKKGDSLLRCPFCGEDDFDMIGLKNHLERYCEPYQNIETIEQERQKKKAYPDDKWQSQKEVVPIGLGERGWQAYEDYKKSDSKGPQKSVLQDKDLKQAVDQLMVDKDRRYMSEVKEKLVNALFDSDINKEDRANMVQEIEQIQKPFDLMKYYYYAVSKYEIGSTDTEIESDYGFFDGPTDLGKRPKGDFPSVQWMPRGHEDEDVRDDDYLQAGEKKSQENLDREALQKALYEYGDKQSIDYWTEQYLNSYIEDFRETYREHRDKEPSPNVIEHITEEILDQPVNWWETEYGDTDVQNWISNLEGYTLEQLQQDYPEIYNLYQKQPQKTSNKAMKVEWLVKQAEEDLLLDKFERQIASKYGPEYNSALIHYKQALQDGHPKDRAFQYAIAEMKKLDAPVREDILLEVIHTYV